MKKFMFLKVVLISFICIAIFACSRPSTNKKQEENKEKKSTSTPSVKLIGKYPLENPPKLSKNIHGALGSSLLHLPGDPDNIFYSSSDRGPNGKMTVNSEERRTFPIPKYTPAVYKMEISKGKLKIVEIIQLKLPNGSDPVTGSSTITGLPNFKKFDEAPYDAKGKNVLSYDPYGLDTEGLAYNPTDQTFWLSDEYRPSLVQIKKDGTLVKRLIPSGMESKFKNAPLIPVKGSLPAVLTKRMENKGFESVTITPDGRYLFTMTQSALSNPGENSRVVRILKINVKNSKVIAEYAYLADNGRKLGFDQKDIGVSDLYAINEHHLLVDERDSEIGKKAKLKKIYKINFQGATNILGRDKHKGKTLEQMNAKDLKAAGIKMVAKKEVLNLLNYDYPYEKAEGMSLVQGKKLAVINDDDFGMEDPNSKTELWLFRLP
ncbi:esterase-like activity of phytase family protein [Fictibacillus terranigra]|uniref:Esterase-like activity of phytase family protein n=1 Tax=Fictibacillus terranigra TaxID=3058424 RepID=A0ABT8EAY9_9BACL|nr:esterase-like activity of phytase family protein [Fictibacillus sp. CENA-BCM004]MDN4075090.1 esterase-like activity of phytase family protein [Fictibacillus sp. CENA-BCM004]